MAILLTVFGSYSVGLFIGGGVGFCVAVFSLGSRTPRRPMSGPSYELDDDDLGKLGITREQAVSYLSMGGVSCPKCRSQDIEGEVTQHDSGDPVQEIWCKRCDLRWLDVYQLASIEPVAE